MSSLVIDSYPIAVESDPLILRDFDYLYQFYLNFFYILYLLVIIIIAIIECRRSYTFIYKLNFLLYLGMLTLFSVFFFIFL